MAVAFNSIPLAVITDGSIPLPQREDGTGIPYYSARVKLASRADLISLQDSLSVVTVQPAIGILGGGTAIVEKGIGERDLIYPDGTDEHTVGAILLSIAPVGRSLTVGPYLVDCRWLITEAIT